MTLTCLRVRQRWEKCYVKSRSTLNMILTILFAQCLIRVDLMHCPGYISICSLFAFSDLVVLNINAN